MNGRIHRLLTFTCFVVRLSSSPFHNSDKQPDLTGPTFAALTPLAALFDCPDPSRARLCGPSGSNLGARSLSDPSKTMLFLRFFIHLKKLQLLL